MRKKLFVALSTFAQYGQEPLEILQESGFDFSVNPLGKRLVQDDIIRLAKDSQGIIAGVEPYDANVLGDLSQLCCISRCGVGIDNIDLAVAKNRQIKIYNTPEVVIQPVVELTIAMIFDLLRKLTVHTGFLKSGEWKKLPGHLLKGKTVGILGLGRIGRRVAEMMSKLETEVLGCDIHPDNNWAALHEVALVDLDTLLQRADVLSLHLSVVEEQPFQLGEKEMARMKQGAFLINVSRGQLVDENALCAALKTGHLAGAALDVYPHEPYTGKLRECENVVLTPHIATLTKESRLQMEIEATQNLINHFTYESVTI